jgi:hypothetical protein
LQSKIYLRIVVGIIISHCSHEGSISEFPFEEFDGLDNLTVQKFKNIKNTNLI